MIENREADGRPEPAIVVEYEAAWPDYRRAYWLTRPGVPAAGRRSVLVAAGAAVLAVLLLLWTPTPGLVLLTGVVIGLALASVLATRRVLQQPAAAWSLYLTPPPRFRYTFTPDGVERLGYGGTIRMGWDRVRALAVDEQVVAFALHADVGTCWVPLAVLPPDGLDALRRWQAAAAAGVQAPAGPATATSRRRGLRSLLVPALAAAAVLVILKAGRVVAPDWFDRTTDAPGQACGLLTRDEIAGVLGSPVEQPTQSRMDVLNPGLYSCDWRSGPSVIVVLRALHDGSAYYQRNLSMIAEQYRPPVPVPDAQAHQSPQLGGQQLELLKGGAYLQVIVMSDPTRPQPIPDGAARQLAVLAASRFR